jgi:NADPH2:quinone reductase
MGYAYIIEQQGRCEVLKKIKTKDKPLQPGQVRLKQLYIGLNYQDILLRRGDKKVKSAFVPGFEACGIIEEVAPDVKNFHIGDKVVYSTAPIGACTNYRNIKTQYLVKVPDFIKMEEVCGFFLKGLWAHTLVKRVYKVSANDKILVHSAAGGVGTVLTQILTHLDAQVIGSVGSEDKIDFAMQNGCVKALTYENPDFFNQVRELTNNFGVHAVYDPIGAKVFEISMLSLAIFGIYVTYGSISGPITNLNSELLAKKSLFISSPTLMHYKSANTELINSAAEIFNLRKNNIIKNNICKTFEFDNIIDAHKYLEQRKSIGSIVIKV